MSDTGVITLLLIIANIAISWKGFKNEQFFDGYKFDVDRILINRDYKRLITSGFLHVSWMHLIFNVMSLYFFSGLVEATQGGIKYLIIYFSGLVGGNLLSLFIHRHHGDYNAVGASGAVCGVIFASIALFPGMDIGLFFLPIHIPAWIYGLLYILFSIYGIRSRDENVGMMRILAGR